MRVDPEVGRIVPFIELPINRHVSLRLDIKTRERRALIYMRVEPEVAAINSFIIREVRVAQRLRHIKLLICPAGSVKGVGLKP